MVNTELELERRSNQQSRQAAAVESWAVKIRLLKITDHRTAGRPADRRRSLVYVRRRRQFLQPSLFSFSIRFCFCWVISD
jgi:hypothetical protein